MLENVDEIGLDRISIEVQMSADFYAAMLPLKATDTCLGRPRLLIIERVLGYIQEIAVQSIHDTNIQLLKSFQGYLFDNLKNPTPEQLASIALYLKMTMNVIETTTRNNTLRLLADIQGVDLPG